MDDKVIEKHAVEDRQKEISVQRRKWFWAIFWGIVIMIVMYSMSRDTEKKSSDDLYNKYRAEKYIQEQERKKAQDAEKLRIASEIIRQQEMKKKGY